MSKYLDLSDLDNSSIKYFVRCSTLTSEDEKMSFKFASRINKKVLIVDELEKAYKIRIFYKRYIKGSNEMKDFSIISVIPKGKLFYVKGNKAIEPKVIEEDC